MLFCTKARDVLDRNGAYCVNPFRPDRVAYSLVGPEQGSIPENSSLFGWQVPRVAL
jgi:hypothetical protein